MRANSREAFLAPWQAADYAGLKVEALYELLASGDIRADQVDGRWRIRKTDLDAWLDAEISSEELPDLAAKMSGLSAEQAQQLVEQTQATLLPTPPAS